MRQKERMTDRDHIEFTSPTSAADMVAGEVVPCTTVNYRRRIEAWASGAAKYDDCLKAAFDIRSAA